MKRFWKIFSPQVMYPHLFFKQTIAKKEIPLFFIDISIWMYLYT